MLVISIIINKRMQIWIKIGETSNYPKTIKIRITNKTSHYKDLIKIVNHIKIIEIINKITTLEIIHQTNSSTNKTIKINSNNIINKDHLKQINHINNKMKIWMIQILIMKIINNKILGKRVMNNIINKEEIITLINKIIRLK